MRRNASRNQKTGERGSILATSAIGMLSIILAVGLGVDVSRFYLTKTELQNAADASALAAVSALNAQPAGITEAANRAVQSMNSYNFNKTGVSFPRANVLFAVNLDGPYMSEGSAKSSPKNIRFVQVTTPPEAIGVSFSAAVLGNSKNITATATAGFSIPLNVFCDWLPVSVIDYDIPMVPGQTYTIRAGSTSSVSPGNYQILAVAGSGGKDVRIGLGSGVDLCAAAGATYSVDTKTGVTAGAVRQGINTRFDEYVTSQVDPNTMPPDTNIKENITYSQYANGSPTQSPTHTGTPNRRVVIIPIVKLAQYNQGRNEVTFDRFGQFFLQTKVGSGSGGDIVAEYINDIVVDGSGGYDPNGGPANNLQAIPVLYK